MQNIRHKKIKMKCWNNFGQEGEDMGIYVYI